MSPSYELIERITPNVWIASFRNQKVVYKLIQIDGLQEVELTKIASKAKIGPDYVEVMTTEQYDTVLITTYYDETLTQYLDKPKNMIKLTLQEITIQLFELLKSCAESSISYCDLHTGNIVVDNKTQTLRLIDFGRPNSYHRYSGSDHILQAAYEHTLRLRGEFGSKFSIKQSMVRRIVLKYLKNTHNFTPKPTVVEIAQAKASSEQREHALKRIQQLKLR